MFIINLQFLTLQYFWKWIYHTGQRSRDTTKCAEIVPKVLWVLLFTILGKGLDIFKKCAKIVPKVLWVLLSTTLGKGLEILQNVQKLYQKYYEFSSLPYWAKVWRYYKMCKTCTKSIMNSPLYHTGQRSGDTKKCAKIVPKVLWVLSTILGKGLEILQNVQKLYPKYYEFSCLPYWAKVWRYYKMCKNCIQSIMSSPLYHAGQRSRDTTKCAKIVSKVLWVLLFTVLGKGLEISQKVQKLYPKYYEFSSPFSFMNTTVLVNAVVQFLWWYHFGTVWIWGAEILPFQKHFSMHTHTHTHMCAHTHTHTHTCAHTHTYHSILNKNKTFILSGLLIFYKNNTWIPFRSSRNNMYIRRRKNTMTWST